MPTGINTGHCKNESGINSKIDTLLTVIDKGNGDELLTLQDLKVSGSHPFSDSTRHRKIRAKEYPAPIKLSPQMCVWKVSQIRAWRNDPSGYKASIFNGGAK